MFRVIVAVLILPAFASASVIIDDLSNGPDAGFNYDFGTDSDFTGVPNGDFNSFTGGGLLLASDAVDIDFGAPVINAPTDFIANAIVRGEDFVDGAPGLVTFVGFDVFGNPAQETLDVSDRVYVADSASTVVFEVSSIRIEGFEMRVDEVEVLVIPEPASMTLLGVVGLVAARLRRR